MSRADVPGPAETEPEAARSWAGSRLHWHHALILGVVEGVTEFLPISSTGHLFVVERLMGLSTNAREQGISDSLGISIQIGAILAVVGLYRHRVLSILRGLGGCDPEGLRLAKRLLLAFLPAALCAAAFQHWIRRWLFRPWPIVAAWALGGLAILVIGRWRRQHPVRQKGLEDLGRVDALAIGLVQCIAMWPGVSRSLVTIAGGLAIGLKPQAAVEFSFLLGLLTLGVATAHEATTMGRDIIDLFGWLGPLVALGAAALSAAASMRWMVGYLQRHGFALFGWYRIVVATAVAGLLLTGHLPQ